MSYILDRGCRDLKKKGPQTDYVILSFAQCK